jgi:transcriptional regulator with XRE-family HTH domain
MTLSPAQCRAGRALLNWTQEDLVRHSKITKKTVADFERGATQPRTQTLAQITAAFEAAGIEFLNGSAPGVRLKSDLNSSPTKLPKSLHARRSTRTR